MSSNMKPTQEDVFEYLDELRDSGVTNMWGSPAYVEREFGITWNEATKWVSKWMDSFKKDAK